jgi:hypothetical protein
MKRHTAALEAYQMSLLRLHPLSGPFMRSQFSFSQFRVGTVNCFARLLISSESYFL